MEISGNGAKSGKTRRVLDLNSAFAGKVFDSSHRSGIPCGMSTHAADGYLSIFILQNEQKQEKKDGRKR